MNIIGPLGWHPSSLEHRLFETSPTSVDAESRSVNAILSTGAPVQRFYGREILAISKAAVDIDRVPIGQCPLLDSHQADGISNVLGRVDDVWFKGGSLWGRLKFGLTPQANMAWGMVQRNEISAISIGYRVTEWEIRDADGEIIDQELSYSNAYSFTYEAIRWQLLEASICSVAADSGAGIRDEADINTNSLADVRARMETRQRMHDRMSLLLCRDLGDPR